MLLSHFTLREDKKQELMQMLRVQRDSPQIRHIEVLQKRVKLNPHNNEKNETRYIRSYGNITVYSDAKCFDGDIDYFDKDAQHTLKILPDINNIIIKRENQRKEQSIKQLQHFKRQIYVWFYRESLRPPTVQPTGKRTYMQPTITIKSDKKEGIQVSGTILTRDGYKITFPNIQNIIKMSTLWEEENHTVIKRSFHHLRVKEHLDLTDQMDELKTYVWKIKQYKQFFKVLLKHSINNIEIKKVLVKVSELLKTSINHSFLFYQVSSKAWAICGMIKDLNNRNLTQRERREWLSKLQLNINEDLTELFDGFGGGSLLPHEEHFVSFQQYVGKLQHMVQKRGIK